MGSQGATYVNVVLFRAGGNTQATYGWLHAIAIAIWIWSQNPRTRISLLMLSDRCQMQKKLNLMYLFTGFSRSLKMQRRNVEVYKVERIGLKTATCELQAEKENATRMISEWWSQFSHRISKHFDRHKTHPQGSHVCCHGLPWIAMDCHGAR